MAAKTVNGHLYGARHLQQQHNQQISTVMPNRGPAKTRPNCVGHRCQAVRASRGAHQGAHLPPAGYSQYPDHQQEIAVGRQLPCAYCVPGSTTAAAGCIAEATPTSHQLHQQLSLLPRATGEHLPGHTLGTIQHLFHSSLAMAPTEEALHTEATASNRVVCIVNHNRFHSVHRYCQIGVVPCFALAVPSVNILEITNAAARLI